MISNPILDEIFGKRLKLSLNLRWSKPEPSRAGSGPRSDIIRPAQRNHPARNIRSTVDNTAFLKWCAARVS